MAGKRFAVVLVAFVLVACGGEGTAPEQTGGGGGGGGGGGSGPTAPTVTNSINVNDDNYTPKNAQTTVGSTVTWTWRGQNLHDVTFESGPSSVTQSSGTFSRQFTATGTFNYLCSVHGSAMSGSILVVP